LNFSDFVQYVATQFIPYKQKVTPDMKTHPLTRSQMGIYVTCANTQEEGNYNIDMLYKLDEDVNIERLIQALDKVIEAHPYVKSRLVTDENGEVMFEDHSDDEFHTSVFETADIEDVRAHLGEDYDLMHDRLFRLEIYKTQKGNYLYVDFHHIIFDGFSFKVFIDDLAKAYDGEALEIEKVNGTDIALAEVEERKSTKYEEAKSWYAQEYSAASEVDSMPLADIYGDDETHYGRKYVKLNIDAAAKDAVCQKAGVRESVLFTAAFGMTLAKYVGENEVLYNTVYHGRQNAETHRAFTMMVKTLPVYHNLEKTPTVVELLQQTKTQNRNARENACYSYGDIASDLGVKSDINFAYQGEYHTLDLTLNGKKQAGEELITNTPGIKFLAMVMINDDEYNFWLEYQKNKYSEAFINGFIATYEHILSEMCQKETLAEIEPCNEEQLAKLDSFNVNDNDNDALRYDDNETVLSLFQKAAKQYPDNIAAVFKEKQYTYKQLDELTDKIGALIYNKVKDCGKQEPVVSILIPRNEYMFILPLSVMKAGCAYQPLDPSYPQERLNFMVKDADAALLIADNDLKDIVNEYEGEVLLTRELTEDKLNNLIPPQPNNLTPQSLFILLYTSGSTGVPKGVMLEHQNLVSFIKWYRRYYDLKPEHNVAAYASFGFDANMMDMYPALTTGATLHVVAEELRLDLIALNEYFENNHITHSFITTQVGVQFLLNAGNHSLKHLTIGGEKLMSVEPAANYAFYNAYGPTECTIFTTTFPVQAKEPNIPIGKPTDELECYVMDKQLHRLPVGAAGELVIVGKQVGRGYLNRPDKTAEAFFTYNGKRAYHSGDIVRYREDGNIEFVGRKDGQVKIRGFRIELKEVEAVIRDFEGINDVTVQAFDDPNGGKFIAAYVASDKEVDIEELNRFILDQKPPYMVPAVTMQIPEIPLNVNQKVDKKALPKPEIKVRTAKDAPAAPLNALEIELKAIIASVVNTEEFGITDVLGFVGLTSISSIKLATLIYKKFGIQINSKTLVKTGSLQSIENEILNHWLYSETGDNSKSSQTTSCPEPFADGQNGEGTREGMSIPLSYPQMGVYLDCLKNPGSTMYNVPFHIVMPEGVTAEELQEAVKATVENHKSFRLTFGTVNGENCQTFNADMPIEVPITEMSEAIVAATAQSFVRPFNIAVGPLFRFEIVKSESNLHLFVDMHHLVTDGGSFDIIVKEISARLNGDEVENEDYSYMQFAIDQKSAEDGEEFQSAKSFFNSRFATCEGASEITGDMPKNDEACHTLGISSRPVIYAPVEELAKRLGVTPMSVFLAAAYYTVSRFVNNKQVYLGTISNGRSNLRTYNTTGMFVNTLALSSEIKEQTVSDYIKETAENFTETITHEQYPFARIAADYGFKPEIMFEYQVGVINNNSVRGKQIAVKGLTLDLAKFKAKIAICDSADGGHEIQIGYDEAVYSPALVQTLAASMSAVVEHFVSQPDALAKNISIMSKEQKEQVAAMHTTALLDVPFKRFYEPIEYWAKETPDALAVYACDRQLTFRQFNEECNRVAHALMARGVKRGDRVVLLLPRISQVLCCIFGVSKTGAAYIPCDPAYPAERINLITEDSEATYVITTSEHVAEHEGKAILVDELFAYNEGNCLSNPNNEVSPEDLAYLIYTSGSTGRPKGVMLRHIGICSYLYDHPANVHIHSLKTEGVKAFICITTLSFDMSLKEFAGSLHNGITAVLANEDEVNNPILLAELFRKTGAQAINGTPSRILNCMESEDFCEALSHCKVIWSGGEKYSDKLLERLHAMDIRIFNTYGPTEITVSSNIGELTNQKNITVGRPLLNYTEFVVDSDGNELPVGVVGELYIGGPGVAQGYNNLPEQTAARFIEYNGIKVYRSGDYARWLPDGQVDILGRLDNQVKLNGLRIELGEVESAISKVEGVKQTVVIIRNIDGRDHLSAYYVAEHDIDIEDMKSQIGQTLTHYMVPTAYLQMDHFPLTPNGKTDVKNLPAPQLAKVGGDYVAPRNKIEEDFCHVIEKILGLEKVSAADSFFELGGTSLTATRVIIEAKNFGYDIAYADVFTHPTAQKLANLVGGETEANHDPEVTNYDYTKINALLKENILDNFRKGERLELGNVILTGANGYLGIHILHDLLENHLQQHPDCKVVCLVRHGRNGVSSETRLRNLLFYYFEKNYKEYFGNQLVVVDGDVTNPSAFDEVEKYVNPSETICTLINCAAIVKHFSEGTEIEDVNIGGAQNCVDFCLKTGARLIQTSTNSTGGQSVNGYPDPNSLFSEQVHYFGQALTSKYTHSKFLAERIVLESIIEKGLVAKVVRLGNLAPRAKDGEFQINFRSNSAMGRLHIFQMLGVCSYNISVSKMEFSPIDEVAEAILLLSTTPKECCIFHPFNDHMVKLGDVVLEMARTLNVDIAEVEEEEFEAKLQEAAQDAEKAKILQSMLAYKAGGKDKVSSFAKYNPYTIQVLARLGFHWNVTSWDYVRRFISAIAALNFFEDKR